MKADTYTQDGKKKGSVEIPEAVFGAPWNPALVHQVVISMLANERTPVAHTKDRSEVRGGGKKPWQQKGLGRARHGSIRSPIWKGGGVAFGPRNEKVYARKINRQMRIKALYSALSKKVKDGEVLFVDSLAFSAPSTKGASGFMHALAGVKGHEDLKDKKHNAAYIALTQKDAQVQKSFNNLGNVKVGEVRNLSAKDAVTYRYIIIVGPKEGAALLEARGGNRQEEEKEANVTK